ncbi:uncharacterized protein KGF55_002357 [Candida pseudojiufengensis]|uniref:uncharacterized protein n=1 Tax=Candida pseudojiufengensis TaxID=497109 RepID=UPI002225482A|nr:uncharacterized protein KGF55_002357 [Candida pseudojiufengensis]KAI5963477.1 hypothetical protein KGF55_002357 [Candida pseudojiufengensis]
MSYVSDSEEESIVPVTSLISNHKLNEKLKNLSSHQRNNIIKMVQILMPKMNSTTVPNPDIIDDSEDEANDPLRLFDFIPHNEETRNITDCTEEDVLVTENKENENHLKAYMSSKAQDYAPIRTLRKRNFASTHPYLSDQAYYLGLADISELNSIYEENNHSLESIVKLLNYNYMKLKEKYPRDEKFKQKNFYAILGKQSKAAQQVEAEESGTQISNDVEFEESQNAANEILPSQMSVQEFAASEIESPEESQDEDEGSSSDDEEIQDKDVYVRVGGKFRKEKSALKGILPESAKHLPIYRNNKQNGRKNSKQKTIEIRKGMAIKKSRKNRSLNVRETMDDLIDDNIYSEDEIDFQATNYQNIDQLADLENDYNINYTSDTFDQWDDSSSIDNTNFDGTFPGARSVSPIVLSDFSDSSMEPESDDDLNLFVHSDHEEEDLQAVIDLNDEAIESSVIDRMLAPNNIRKSNPSIKPNKKSSNTTTKPRSSNTKASGTPSKRNGSTKSNKKPKPPSRTPKSKTKHKQSRLFRESYRQLSVKPISRTQSTNKRRKKENTKQKSMQKSIDKYINPGRVDNLRTPIYATTAFEAEGNQSIKVTKYQKYSTNSNIINLSTQPEFVPGCILNLISLNRLHHAADGKSLHKFTDPIELTYKETKFCFSLINLENSIDGAESLLKSINNDILKSNLNGKEFERSIYDCMKGLIGWYLLSQRSPTLVEWALVNSLLSNVKESTLISNSNKLFFVPYVILLQYVMFIGEQINGIGANGKFCVQSSGTFYWSLWFPMFDSNDFEKINYAGGDGIRSKETESFYIICTILELQKSWWSSITASIDEFYTSFDLEILLEAIFCLIQISRTPSWKPLQAYFMKLNDDMDAGIYYRYVDILYSTCQFRNWHLDESLLLQIHGSILKRNFANLQDEEMDQEIYHQIKSRYDIGGESFYDRYMQLLSWHISSMSDDSQVKRFITKLYSSNDFQYSNDKKHRVMFINRFNLIILLASYSSSDQRNQISNLINSMKDVTDLKFVKAAVKGLTVTTQIIFSKKLKLPMDALQAIMIKLNSIWFNKPGMKKLWNYFMSPINKLVDDNADEAFQFLLLAKPLNVNTTKQMNNGIINLCLKIIQSLNLPKLNHAQIKIIQNVSGISLKLLEHYMMENSDRNQEVIKNCISLWISTWNALGNNWDQIVLQKFPYIGVESEREKYVLFFYSKVLVFHDIRSCKEIVISNILNGLMLPKPPVDSIELMKALAYKNWDCFSFMKMYNFDNMEHPRLRFNIFSKLIHSLSTRSDFSTFVSETLKRLIKDIWDKDFANSVLKELSKYTNLDFKAQTQITELSSKIGYDQPQFQILPFEQQIEAVDIELSKDDDEFETEDLDILYYFMGKESTNKNWHVINKLVYQFHKALFKYKFKLTNCKFYGFLNLLQTTWQNDGDRDYDESKILAMITICNLFFDIKYILFEGYWPSKTFETLYENLKVYVGEFSQHGHSNAEFKEALEKILK